ncbi:MAG: hypothetical protein IK123_02580, partial [Lachnospiraceae bacterium]|nr:hypothetical protein [Lachnospiraceae bacterium]
IRVVGRDRSVTYTGSSLTSIINNGIPVRPGQVVKLKNNTYFAITSSSFDEELVSTDDILSKWVYISVPYNAYGDGYLSLERCSDTSATNIKLSGSTGWTAGVIPAVAVFNMSGSDISGLTDIKVYDRHGNSYKEYSRYTAEYLTAVGGYIPVNQGRKITFTSYNSRSWSYTSDWFVKNTVKNKSMGSSNTVHIVVPQTISEADSIGSIKMAALSSSSSGLIILSDNAGGGSTGWVYHGVVPTTVVMKILSESGMTESMDSLYIWEAVSDPNNYYNEYNEQTGKTEKAVIDTELYVRNGLQNGGDPRLSEWDSDYLYPVYPGQTIGFLMEYGNTVGIKYMTSSGVYSNLNTTTGIQFTLPTSMTPGETSIRIEKDENSVAFRAGDKNASWYYNAGKYIFS